MNTIFLAPVSKRGRDLIVKYGDEWLIVETRGMDHVITDMDEHTRIHFNPVTSTHFKLKENTNAEA